ncbi:hypothetical protein DFH09DRAFT_1306390 [Mycena vulgaris]|nr:hypothetical protein DFH09DRAFT_1306390 [Mycena vulgaris]
MVYVTSSKLEALILAAATVLAVKPPTAVLTTFVTIVASNIDARGHLTLYGDHAEIYLPSDNPGALLLWLGKYHYRVPSHTDSPYLRFRTWSTPEAIPWLDVEVAPDRAWSTLSDAVKLEDYDAGIEPTTFANGDFVLFPYEHSVVAIFLTKGGPAISTSEQLRFQCEISRIIFAWSIFEIARTWLALMVTSKRVPVPGEPQPRGQKRKREEPDGREKSVDGQNSDATDEDDSSIRTDHEDQPPLDVYHLTDSLAAEIREDDVWYPGFSKVICLVHDCRRTHPEVSAVVEVDPGE